MIHVNRPTTPAPAPEGEEEPLEPCCMGVAVYGPERCTCWEPVFDVEQAEADTSIEVVTCEKCCDDCAFRNGSPERTEEMGEDELMDIVASGTFFCHKGMRRVVGWRHPDGRYREAARDDYKPLIVGGVAYQIDGKPAKRCAGWAAHKRVSA